MQGASRPGRQVLALGLPKRGRDDITPFSLDTNAEVGPDWRNALSAWLEAHAYYPEQAGKLGQEGSPIVAMTIAPDGRVTSLELERPSGSQWLDLGLLGLFRNAKLPPPPKVPDGSPFSLRFTMHYMIIPR
jgi:protein TonB